MTYHDAYAIGMAAVAVLLALALLAGVVDLAGRRRDDVLVGGERVARRVPRMSTPYGTTNFCRT